MASSMDAKSQAYLEQYLQTLSQQGKRRNPIGEYGLLLR